MNVPRFSSLVQRFARAFSETGRIENKAEIVAETQGQHPSQADLDHYAADKARRGKRPTFIRTKG